MSKTQQELLEKLSPEKRALLAERLGQRKKLETVDQTAMPKLARQEGENSFPLSSAQARIWFYENVNPGTPRYNFANSYRFIGKLNEDALHFAINEIVKRHEVLRAYFPDGQEDPVQVIRPSMTVSINRILPEPGQSFKDEASLIEIMKETSKELFNLQDGPLVRVNLYRVSEEEHVLLWMTHHIVYDLWSARVFDKEFQSFYQSYLTGEQARLTELPVQYPDYAAWQQGWVGGEEYKKQLAYWQNRLAKPLPLLDLPIDFNRKPLENQYVMKTFEFAIPASLVKRIRESGKTLGCTLYISLLSAYKLLLQRYSGQNDMIVSSAVTNRTKRETIDLIGYFANTVALRTKIEPEISFRELVKRVQEAVLEANDHQDVPFNKVVEALKPERSLMRSTLIETMFLLEGVPHGKLINPQLEMIPIEVDRMRGGFDVTLAIWEDGDEAYPGTLTYNPELFTEQTIRRMHRHLISILDLASSQPELPLHEITKLPQEDYEEVVVSWNNRNLPVLREPEPAFQQFERQAERLADQEAVRCENKSYTYKQLNEKANQMARYLGQLGVKSETVVGLYLDRSLDMMAGLLGVMKSGGAYVPLDPKNPIERVKTVIQEAGVSILFTESELAEEVLELPGVRTIVLDTDEVIDAIEAMDAANLNVTVSPEQLGYLLFTSGSTGKPKGIGVEHRQLSHYISGIMQELDLKPNWHYAMVTTFAADLGSTMIWGALIGGGTLHILKYERAADPDAFAAYFRKHPIDCMKIVPSHFEALLNIDNPADVLPRERLIFAGEASHWEMIDTIRKMNPTCTIQNHYGPTETTVSVLTYPVPSRPPAYKSTVPLGRPIAGVSTYVLDELGKPVPIGAIGELYIGGLTVTRGYYGQPELTEERFLPNPFSSEAGSRFYRTGDLVRYWADGNIEFIGRTDFQVKIRGFRIETGEVESVILAQKDVRDAIVIAREDTPGDKRLVAYVIPSNSEAYSTSELRKSLKDILPDYMVPSAFCVMDQFPLNANGKIERKALPLPEASLADMADLMVAPRNEIETRIAQIWSETLELPVEQIGIDHDFFDIGGESLKAIKIVRKIGSGVSVMDMIKYPTIRELAERMGASRSGEGTKLLHELTRPISAAIKDASVICLPFGGGSAITFRNLAEALPARFSLFAADLPGHDFSRADEPLEPLDAAMASLLEEIKLQVKGPILLYGHCVGGAAALKLAYMLEEEGFDLRGVFMAGTFPAARLPGKLFEWWHRFFPRHKLMSTKMIKETFRAFGGLDDSISEEEQTFMMRSSQHDGKEAEDYYTSLYSQQNYPKLKAPITCVVGGSDRMTLFYEEQYADWEDFSDNVNLRVIPNAGHYFQKHQPDELAEHIVEQNRMWKAAGAVSASNQEVASAAESFVGKQDSRRMKPSMAAFFVVSFSRLISMMGSNLLGFALGLWVYQETGSVGDFAMISVFAMIPGILLLPFAGAIADRYDRRKIMMASEVMALVATGFIGILYWTDNLLLWHMCAAAVLSAMAGSFMGPASQAAVTQLVPKRYLAQANSINGITNAVTGIAAPALGGLMVVSIGMSGLLMIDIVSFVFCLFALSMIRFPNRLYWKAEEPIMKEILGGWNYIIKRKSLVAMVLFFMLTNFLMTLFNVLTTPLVMKFSTADVLGFIYTGWGVGTLVGSLLISIWGGFSRRTTGMVGSVVLIGLSVILTGLQPHPAFPFIGLLGFGFALAFLETHWQSIIQAKVGLELQGRVFAMNMMLAFLMRPISFIVAGPLADDLFEPLMMQDGAWSNLLGPIFGVGEGRGIGVLVTLIGIVLFVWGIIGMKYRPLRDMETILPDIIPDALIIKDKDKLQELADQQLQEAMNAAKESKGRTLSA
ncbi:non-ribosomal peptide synthetase/MFS transporter [Paenibacillus sp. MMS18-CY102]|uniref:non-ribosomal peptide synthetase/MFS transporter n=1 Tax=Paenibacillus sp. MMS18-CY102 TaxID=2682849 RepID=UPI0013663CC2|nr:non-ribosomal peptide synthetase/MFS transporter [Paenibacillus sp. MMS18-CY102]MWC27752.1 amino acid adenylation domain-containing protein [Paenibacillus sp. MMS18-CY102]